MKRKSEHGYIIRSDLRDVEQVLTAYANMLAQGAGVPLPDHPTRDRG